LFTAFDRSRSLYISGLDLTLSSAPIAVETSAGADNIIPPIATVKNTFRNCICLLLSLLNLSKNPRERRKNRVLKFAGNRFADLLYRFTGFPAGSSALLLKVPGDAFSFAFGFEFGILDQFPSLVLDRPRNLLALTFDLIFVPHTCLLQSSDPYVRIGLIC